MLLLSCLCWGAGWPPAISHGVRDFLFARLAGRLYQLMTEDTRRSERREEEAHRADKGRKGRKGRKDLRAMQTSKSTSRQLESISATRSGTPATGLISRAGRISH